MLSPMTESEPVAASKKKTTTHRSWYLAVDAADDLQAEVDNLHFELRVPKHAALTAIIRTGLAHSDEVRERLDGSDPSS